jgi:transcriptional regulator with XRE-family HTH domain
MADLNSPHRSFTDRLNHLFETIRPAGSTREYTNVEVAHAVGVTDMYIGQLRRGQRTNPSAQLVANLERFFGLTQAYLYNDDPQAVGDVDGQLSLFRMLRDTGVLPLAARATEIRTPEGRALLAAAIEHIIRGEPNNPDLSPQPDLGT